MKRIFIILFMIGCSLQLPAKLPQDLKSPINIEKNGKVVTIYIESEADAYTILGIHPLSGREFLLKVKAGKVISEEYGYIFSKSEVREILKEKISERN